VAVATFSYGCSANEALHTPRSPSDYRSGALAKCQPIEGDFVFRGVSDMRSTTFLRAMARPGGAGIDWFRLAIDVSNQRVHVHYFNGASEKTMESFIPAQCVNGVLVEIRVDTGSQGGQRGPDSMELTYSRATNGDLLVNSKSRGTTHYLPVVPSSYTAEGTARFASKQQ
jgi:hypothetical protein